MTAAAGATARRWIALAAAAAIVAHAFGMGVLGPRMAGGVAPPVPPVPVVELADAGDFPHNSGSADHEDHGSHRLAGPVAAHSGQPGAEPDPVDEPPSHKHQRSCEACPLGQSGMALAPPLSFPAAPIEANIASLHTIEVTIALRYERHRLPPARAPPMKA